MATYTTKYAELRLIVKPQRIERTNSGNNIIPGESIEFKNGAFVTEMPTEMKFIEAHRMFGVDIFKQKSTEEMEDALIAKADKVKVKRETKKAKKTKK